MRIHKCKFLLITGSLGTLGNLLSAHENITHIGTVNKLNEPVVDFSKLKLANDEIPCVAIGICTTEEHAGMGHALAFALMSKLDQHFAYVDFSKQQEEVSQGSIEEIVMQIHKGFHEEILRLSVVVDDLSLLKQNNYPFVKQDNFTLQGNTQKFNHTITRHPP